MSQAKVNALRCVDLGFADPGKAVRFFTEVWNLTTAGDGGGAHYLRGTGAFHHILAVRQTPQPALIRMVLDAADRATVDALHAQVLAHRLKTVDPPAPLRQPHGDYGFGFKDPEGRNIAIVCGVRDHADAGDRPDRPRKLSHVNVNCGDSHATLACYRDALGFTGGATLNHIAFELPDLDSVMRGAGRMRDHGRPIEWGPGRHGPGNNVFCYFLGPEDMPVELTAEMQQVDATHRARMPEQWTWLPGRLDHWGISGGPSTRIDDAGLRYRFTEDGYRLDEWR